MTKFHRSISAAMALVLAASTTFAQTVSNLPTASSVSSADYVVVNQSGTTKKASVSALGTQVNAVVATGATGSQTSAARAAQSLSPRDFNAACDGSTDDTTAFNSTVTAAASGYKHVTVNCPIFLGSPASVTVPSTVNLEFKAGGQLLWNFGGISSFSVLNNGRGYTAVPTVTLTSPASCTSCSAGSAGAVTMQLYYPVIGSGGTGYQAGDVLTLSGGTSTTAAQVQVGSVSGGVISTLSVFTAGAYTALPSGTISLTGGHGSGATLAAPGTSGTTWNIVSIAVATAGNYNVAAPPTVSLSTSGATSAATIAAIGQQPTLNGNIVAPDTQQIFGGYEHFAGTPNAGVLRAEWFGASPSASDNTFAIQSGFDTARTLRFGMGQFQAAGPLRIRPNLKLLGTAVGAAGNGDSSAWGTVLFASGGSPGNAFVYGLDRDNGGFSVEDIGIGSASSAQYAWVAYIPGLRSSTWDRFLIQNNWSGASGGAYFPNLNTNTNIATLYSPVWINYFSNGQFGTSGGAPLYDELTDSHFSNLYVSGGSGAVAAGLNETWTNIMIDNSSGVCLTVRPSINVVFGQYFNWTGGNTQNCPTASIKFSRNVANTTNAQNMYDLITGVNFNNSGSSTSDIIFDHVNYVTLSGNAFTNTGSATNFTSTSDTDYVEVIGNHLSSGVSGISGTHNFFANNDGVIGGGGSNIYVKTQSGTQVQVLDQSGVTNPIQLQGSQSGVSSGLIQLQGSSALNISAGNTIQLQQSGSTVFKIESSKVTSLTPLIAAQYQTLGGTSPTVSSCGTGGGAGSYSYNNVGYVTFGSGSPTSCTLTFGTAFPNQAYCVVTPLSNISGYWISAQSKTGFTINIASGGSPSFQYICLGS